MADEGFHEFHLGRKQLIFLFMSAAVVLVVAFLCGVLVGRGVHVPGDGQPQETVTMLPAADPPPEEASGPATKVSPPPAALTPPQPVDDDLTYQARLEGRAPAGESVPKASSQQPAAKPAAAKAIAAPPGAEAAAKAGDAVGGHLVQVTALGERSKAEAVAKRLSAKGYKASVVAPGPRGGRMYRVVVGRFKSLQEAEAAKRRLEKEEQFKPWITR